MIKSANAAVGAAMLLLSATATAHVPYLLPSSFEPVRGGWVSLDAAFAERFFLPESVFNNSQFMVFTPTAQRIALQDVHYGHTRATAEYQLEQSGTYRFSTGLRYGAVFHTYEHNGERKSSRDPAFVLPAGAKSIAHFQAVTRAETYVSQGAPDQAALQPGNEALELEFLSHPNDLYADSAVRARVLFNGKPLPQQTVKAYFIASDANDEAPTYELLSDSAGIIQFQPAKAGTYYLLSRLRTAAPKDAAVPTYSYTYSVVLDVTP